MPYRFDISDVDLRRVLIWVCWLFSGWMIGVAALIALSPDHRFANSWQFVMALPGGRYTQAAVFGVLGVLMLVGTITGRQRLLSKCARLAGVGNWVFGTFLLAGAINGPTGVLGAPFAYLVGVLFFMLSVVLGRHRVL